MIFLRIRTESIKGMENKEDDFQSKKSDLKQTNKESSSSWESQKIGYNQQIKKA